MATASDDLEQRLRNLELEQEKQDGALTSLGDLDKEVRQLEAILNQIDNFQIKQNKDKYKRVTLDETKKLEKQLENLDTEGFAPVNKGVTSYVIRLMFNPKSPQEWSGTGWCEFGKGKRYTNLEQVNQICKKLKKQWPTYPLKIFKK